MKAILTSLIFLVIFNSCSVKSTQSIEDAFSSNWKFSLDANEAAILPEFNDTHWQTVQIPHDWSIAFPYDTINGEGCVGYLPGGTGWYRKRFKAPTNKNVSILFDGVYNNSEVWINGHKLGFHPYGYSPFHYDLTPFIKSNNEENILTVKVDRTRFADSRWYPGSGIYRNVNLIIKEKTHFPIWSTWISTPKVQKERADVSVNTKLVNNRQSKVQALYKISIVTSKGETVAQRQQNLEFSAQEQLDIQTSLNIISPELWDIQNPNLYKLIETIEVNHAIVDRQVTPFGVRSFKFDPKDGFTLNGKSIKIKGVCLHHDGGLVGAAVPKEVWRRRLNLLKEGGCNAIRISHNPASDEFLELCDEMGFLVQDEFFDEWDYPKDKRLNMNQRISTDYITKSYTEHFQKWAKKDLQSTILAHRNHPSIIQWSIGNEIEWTYPRNKQSTGFWDADWSGNYFWSATPLTPNEIKERYERLPALKYNIGETAQKLSKWTKELDTTRPVIANCILPSASYASGYADALDIIGFSYRRVMYDYGHKYFPNLPIMGTENVAQYHEWKAIEERSFISGTFLWTGIDYMGEAHYHGSGKRRRGTHSGLLDFAGFPKPSYYLMKSLWSESPTLKITTQNLNQSIYKVKNGNVVEKNQGSWDKRLWFWHDVNQHWNYRNGDSIIVEIISNLPEVELFINKKSFGTKKLETFDDKLYKWIVPYQAGEIVAKGYDLIGKRTIKETIKTAEKVQTIFVESDKVYLLADGKDVAHIAVQLMDKNNNPVYHSEKEITFSVKGSVKILGVDNGDTFSFPLHQSNKIKTYLGRALLIVQAKNNNGKVIIQASSGEISGNSLEIEIK